MTNIYFFFLVEPSFYTFAFQCCSRAATYSVLTYLYLCARKKAEGRSPTGRHWYAVVGGKWRWHGDQRATESAAQTISERESAPQHSAQ